MLDRDLTERIRTIFLHERSCVSISDAAVMLGWSRRRVNEAIAGGEMTLVGARAGKGVRREDVIAQAVELWALEWIERALGPAGASVLPAALRTGRLSARVPGYQIEMLTHLAARRQTTVGHILTFQLEGLATEHLDELSGVIPGFAEAFVWPYGDGRGRVRSGGA